MTLRVALRSLTTRPVRSAVLALGFGFGIAVMAGLLGIGEVILEQARSPALKGGGDVVVWGTTGRLSSARFVLRNILGADPLAGRVAAASPTARARLYLVRDGGVHGVDARGGIPSLERALGDPETSPVDAWVDAPGDAAWSDPDPADLLRTLDRFHPVPDVPARRDSWAEWLYFNGTADDARFYLSFIFGAPDEQGLSRAVARLQLERDGRTTSYSDRATVPMDGLLSGAPDIDVAASSVRLEGLRYRIRLALYRERDDAEGIVPTGGTGPDLTGELTLEAPAGRSLPPFAVRGAGGWVSGYVVPVLKGALAGALEVEGRRIELDGGSGYHDHNWGFWEGVSWQWGQVAGESLSMVWGRIHPPADAVDAERLPGFLMALGPEGPLAFSTDVRILESEQADRDRPESIIVRARGASIDLRMELEIDSVVRTVLTGGRLARDVGPAMSFLQMRARYRVHGAVAGRDVDFTAVGSAETFRGG